MSTNYAAAILLRDRETRRDAIPARIILHNFEVTCPEKMVCSSSTRDSIESGCTRPMSPGHACSRNGCEAAWKPGDAPPVSPYYEAAAAAAAAAAAVARASIAPGDPDGSSSVDECRRYWYCDIIPDRFPVLMKNQARATRACICFFLLFFFFISSGGRRKWRSNYIHII